MKIKMKEKYIKFRCGQEEYDRLEKERETSGMNMSSFIRSVVFRDGNRIIRNPELVASIREVNQEICKICVAVNQLTGEYPPQADAEELKKHLALVEHLESRIIDIISGELKDGNHKTAPP